MKEVSDLVVCVRERGSFFPIAPRLAREVKKVYYCSPNGEASETAWRDSLGHNYPNVEAIRSFWPIKNEIDLFVFPDCRDWEEQLELESQGFPVWGSKGAEELETMRGLWLATAKQIGLPMPHTEVVQGLEALRSYLYEHRDEKKFVKMSRYRGDMETWAAQDWAFTRNKLDFLANKWQGLQSILTFYIQDDLDTQIEGGADTYFVGDFPDEVVIGYEKKSQGYLGAVMKRSKMPPQIWQPAEVLAPILRQFNYSNFFTIETRVVKGKGHLLDPCCRCPSPAGEEELEMLANLAEIIWHGAQGELVQPKWAAKYSGGVVINWDGDKDSSKVLRVPEELQQWVKLCGCAYIDGAFHMAPGPDSEMGFIVGIGDSMNEVLNHLKGVQDGLDGQKVSISLEPIAEMIMEIEEAKEQGIEFGNGKPLPEPAAVLD